MKALLAGAVLVGILVVEPFQELKVERNKENVVASRLEGEWQVNATLTERLRGGISMGRLAFRADPSVVEEIPARMAGALGELTIFMAGYMERYGGRSQETYPFILTAMNGNPHVVWFRDDFGDAESFNVMLAVGDEPGDDLLFVGGDFNNQSFLAYSRQRGACGGSVSGGPFTLDAPFISERDALVIVDVTGPPSGGAVEFARVGLFPTDTLPIIVDRDSSIGGVYDALRTDASGSVAFVVSAETKYTLAVCRGDESSQPSIEPLASGEVRRVAVQLEAD